MNYRLIVKFHKQPHTRMLQEDISSVLIINLQGLGDILMTTPLIKSLSDAGKAVDVLVMGQAKKELLSTNPYVRTVYTFEHVLTTRSKMNKNSYDLVYLAYGAGPKSGLFFQMMRAQYKASHIYTLSGKKTSFNADISLTTTPGMHRVLEHLKLLKTLGIPTPRQPSYTLPISQQNMTTAQQFLREHHLEKKKLIGIHPGGDKHNLNKRYPVQKYQKFIETLPKNYAVIVFIGPDEQEMKEHFNNTIIYSGSLFDIAALIGKCNYFIHNDSGLGHIAASQKVPTLSIFGPANWERVHPWGKDTIIKNKKTNKPQDLPMEKGYIDGSQKMYSGEISLTLFKNT